MTCVKCCSCSCFDTICLPDHECLFGRFFLMCIKGRQEIIYNNYVSVNNFMLIHSDPLTDKIGFIF